jgi:hypothetical protein
MTAPPTYKKLNPADAPILILSAQSDTLPITVVDEYADSFLAQQRLGGAARSWRHQGDTVTIAPCKPTSSRADADRKALAR